MGDPAFYRFDSGGTPIAADHALPTSNTQLPVALAAGGGLKVEGVANGVPVPVLGSRGFVLKGTLAKQAATYAALENIGALVTVATGLPAGTIITAAAIRIKTLVSDLTTGGTMLITFFDANPTGSTTTDKASVAIAAADVAKAILPAGAGNWSTSTVAGYVAVSTTAMPRITVDANGNIYFLFTSLTSNVFASATALSWEIDGTY